MASTASSSNLQNIAVVSENYSCLLLMILEAELERKKESTFSIELVHVDGGKVLIGQLIQMMMKFMLSWLEQSSGSDTQAHDREHGLTLLTFMTLIGGPVAFWRYSLKAILLTQYGIPTSSTNTLTSKSEDYKRGEDEFTNLESVVKIDEEVYVSQPPGFLDSKYPEKVYKVVKALYGLHQAPRAWPDIMFVVRACSRFQVYPKDPHILYSDYAMEPNNLDRKSKTLEVVILFGRETHYLANAKSKPCGLLLLQEAEICLLLQSCCWASFMDSKSKWDAVTLEQCVLQPLSLTTISLFLDMAVLSPVLAQHVSSYLERTEGNENEPSGEILGDPVIQGYLRIIKLKKQAKPVIKHHKAYMKLLHSHAKDSQGGAYSKKNKMHKDVCIQTRIKLITWKQKMLKVKGGQEKMMDEDKELMSTDEQIEGSEEHNEGNEEIFEGTGEQREDDRWIKRMIRIRFLQRIEEIKQEYKEEVKERGIKEKRIMKRQSSVQEKDEVKKKTISNKISSQDDHLILKTSKYLALNHSLMNLKDQKKLYMNVVTRSNGQKRCFSTLIRVLSVFDREDLDAVYKLVMNIYQDKIPEGFDKVLWGDLIVMFNPDGTRMSFGTPA
ncbi:putative ribonuclease H-like domain-containing protein [Tanacetum coccineum]